MNFGSAAHLRKCVPSRGKLDPSSFVLTLCCIGCDAAIGGEAKALFGGFELWHWGGSLFV